jgi:N-acetylmuramoyl-L-alanine amidase
MDSQPYKNLSDLALLELCIWREARGESFDGKRGVAHVIRNRTQISTWWNGRIAGSVQRVVLQPYQFSSFNSGDPNADKWPMDTDTEFVESSVVATLVWLGKNPDNTDGATHYYDISIDWPEAWGPQSGFVNTLNVGRLRFWKLRSRDTHDEVQDAVTAT